MISNGGDGGVDFVISGILAGSPASTSKNFLCGDTILEVSRQASASIQCHMMWTETCIRLDNDDRAVSCAFPEANGAFR